jgi:alanyl-tRNA synthetase
MNSAELRKKYLKFFEEKGHKILPSASLIPEGDSTTLFTGSGMQPMVPFLLGQKHHLGERLADSQKSFRAEDIEEVGDNRHTTFFEMLGNWSLGDYWKEEQLNWIFEFLTKEVGIDPQKLFVSVFSGDPKYETPKDTESAEIWKKLFSSAGIEAKEVDLETEDNAHKVGMQGGRIFYYRDKNWWSRTGLPENMPAGEPGGPDSEIFYEFSEVEHDPKYGKNCHPNCDCGRYLEIGNNVFMEYQKQEDGGFKDLPQKNVDFGGGLERITAASNNNSDIFEIDSLKTIVDKITTLVTKEDRGAMRIIADHIRAGVFLIADGVEPSNKDRGYIVRRLLRRSVTYGQKLGIDHDFLPEVAEVVVRIYSEIYPEVKSVGVLEELKKEELKFKQTLAKGLKILESKSNITGKEAFDLFQTYGFPFELTKEFGVVQNPDEFESEFKKHQELSRTSSAGQFKGGLASHSDKIVRLHTATHLMNAALRKVLGENVWQKGSNITEERTRFDFTHGQKMTDEEKQEVEKLVNNWISRDLSVKKETMPLEEARKLGAIGVFGEKYPDTVSVYTVFDAKTNDVVSREFCGGPHVEHTGVIGSFKIQKEEAVSAGVRRIKAVVT